MTSPNKLPAFITPTPMLSRDSERNLPTPAAVRGRSRSDATRQMPCIGKQCARCLHPQVPRGSQPKELCARTQTDDTGPVQVIVWAGWTSKPTQCVSVCCSVIPDSEEKGFSYQSMQDRDAVVTSLYGQLESKTDIRHYFGYAAGILKRTLLYHVLETDWVGLGSCFLNLWVLARCRIKSWPSVNDCARSYACGQYCGSITTTWCIHLGNKLQVTC